MAALRTCADRACRHLQHEVRYLSLPQLAAVATSCASLSAAYPNSSKFVPDLDLLGGITQEAARRCSEAARAAATAAPATAFPGPLPTQPLVQLLQALAALRVQSREAAFAAAARLWLAGSSSSSSPVLGDGGCSNSSPVLSAVSSSSGSPALVGGGGYSGALMDLPSQQLADLASLYSDVVKAGRGQGQGLGRGDPALKDLLHELGRSLAVRLEAGGSSVGSSDSSTQLERSSSSDDRRWGSSSSNRGGESSSSSSSHLPVTPHQLATAATALSSASVPHPALAASICVHARAHGTLHEAPDYVTLVLAAEQLLGVGAGGPAAMNQGGAGATGDTSAVAGRHLGWRPKDEFMVWSSASSGPSLSSRGAEGERQQLKAGNAHGQDQVSSSSSSSQGQVSGSSSSSSSGQDQVSSNSSSSSSQNQLSSSSSSSSGKQLIPPEILFDLESRVRGMPLRHSLAAGQWHALLNLARRHQPGQGRAHEGAQLGGAGAGLRAGEGDGLGAGLGHGQAVEAGAGPGLGAGLGQGQRLEAGAGAGAGEDAGAALGAAQAQGQGQGHGGLQGQGRGSSSLFLAVADSLSRRGSGRLSCLRLDDVAGILSTLAQVGEGLNLDLDPDQLLAPTQTLCPGPPPQVPDLQHPNPIPRSPTTGP